MGVVLDRVFRIAEGRFRSGNRVTIWYRNIGNKLCVATKILHRTRALPGTAVRPRRAGKSREPVNRGKQLLPAEGLRCVDRDQIRLY
jgi:hypothetical protein